MTARLVLLAMAAAFVGSAQPKFEVVSIKLCKDPKGDEAGDVEASGARFTMKCYSADRMIREAYRLYASGVPWPSNPLTGARGYPLPPGLMFAPLQGSTGWMKSELYTVVAKADRPAGLEMMRGPMLQKVIEDRFHLKLRRDKKEISVFELVVAKGASPKLESSKPGGCFAPTAETGPPKGSEVICGGFRRNDRGGVDTKGSTMSQLCTLLSMNAGRDVIDRTGLTGVYDLHLDVSMDQLKFGRGDDPAEAAAALAAALRKIGLELRAGKLTVETLTIEHIERPTEN
jgi:uncharacterized protein (TIGR03435 family)